MIRYFDKSNNRLVYIGKPASNVYWDKHWNIESSKLEKQIKVKNDELVIDFTKKYLPGGTKILEGGCGLGGKVYTLHYNGYDAYGVDYAKETIEKVNQYAPELKVRIGDVRNLAFPDNFFDGYWSLGVIEHFYEGYDRIVNEMFRVLKPGGYLFLSVPVMSLLRKAKVKLKKYTEYKESEEAKNNFYQFALDPRYVIRDFQERGFELVDMEPRDGIKGFKDEVLILKPFLQRIYDSDTPASNRVKRILDVVLRPFANHGCLFIMRKVAIN